MGDDLDVTLSYVVNVMGMAVFFLVAAYHVVTATPKDAHA